MPPSTVAAYVALRGAPRRGRASVATADAASATGKSSSTLSARVPVSCSWNSNSVTTPKFPPPPRSPQNSSGFSSAEARTTSPPAVTTSQETRLSQDRPCSRASQPMPPPSVSPPTPVCETLPAVVASPCGWVAASSAPSKAPPWTHARRRSASTRTAPIGVRSIISPPSGTASPTTLWPPQRTPISRPSSPGRAIAATTSSGFPAAGDQRRTAVDHRVPHPARLVVPLVARNQELGLRHDLSLADRSTAHGLTGGRTGNHRRSGQVRIRERNRATVSSSRPSPSRR